MSKIHLRKEGTYRASCQRRFTSRTEQMRHYEAVDADRFKEISPKYRCKKCEKLLT